jgi:hypothetical protein
MAVTISIRHNFPEVQRALDQVAENVGNRALVRAMNTTVEQGKTQMARGISQEFRISSAMANDRLSVTRARAKSGAWVFEAKLEATKRGQGRGMNLIAFMEQAVTLAQARKRIKAGEGGRYSLRGREVQKALQLRFQIKRSGGEKVIPGAFIGNRGRTVFIREGKGRLPIKALNTIDIPQMFNTRRINEMVRAVMLQRFQTNFQRELRAVLGGFAK